MLKPFLPPCPPSRPPVFQPDAPWLAPLAGYSDLPFRLLCREYGAIVCETEMISAKGLLYGSVGTAALLASCPPDQPLVAQLFGGEPDSMAAALLHLRKAGYFWFDCNMGCPARKVMRQAAGSALMARLPQAMEIAKAMLAAASKKLENLPEARVGFKLRLPPQGVSPLLDFGRELESAGAAWLTLHPRTAAQGFGGCADWGAIRALAKAVKIPVIASGDLLSAEAGLACLEQTDAAALMYGRGALHNPAIFDRHRELLRAGQARPPNPELLRGLVLRHLALTREYGNPRNAFKKMRSIIPRYVKSLRGVGLLRQNICNCNDWQQLADCVNDFFDKS